MRMHEIKTRLKEVSLINIVLYILGTIYLLFGLFLLAVCIYSIFLEVVFVELFILPVLLFISMAIIALRSASKPVEDEFGKKSKIPIAKVKKVLLAVILVELAIIFLLPTPSPAFMMTP